MHDYAGRVLAERDLVIAVGYDLVEYAPCFWNPDRNKPIIHVDVAPAEVDAPYVVGVGVVGNIALSIEAIGKSLQPCSAEWA
jgi:acetolactate synthase-1/2/3 large subunit